MLNLGVDSLLSVDLDALMVISKGVFYKQNKTGQYIIRLEQYLQQHKHESRATYINFKVAGFEDLIVPPYTSLKFNAWNTLLMLMTELLTRTENLTN